MKSALFGNLTIDINETEKGQYTGPGGSVFYLAATLSNLGVSSTIFSTYGVDFPKKYLPFASFIPDKTLSKKTLRFRNIYNNGRRKQKVENYKDYLKFFLPSLPQVKNDIGIVMIAPVISNINHEQIKKIKEFFPKSFSCLLPQGFYRFIGSHGQITKSHWNPPNEILSRFNFICFSQEDVEDSDTKAKNWSMMGPFVAVTRAQNGSSLYQKGERIDAPAYVLDNIADPTGAGDVFAAAFSFAYVEGCDIGKSLDFAHAAAALSLRVRSDKLQYSYKDVINFTALQKEQ